MTPLRIDYFQRCCHLFGKNGAMRKKGNFANLIFTIKSC